MSLRFRRPRKNSDETAPSTVLLSPARSLLVERQRSSADDFPLSDTPLPSERPASTESRTNQALTGKQVQENESKLTKILVRIVYGVFMFAVFAGSVYLGHVYICGMIFVIETLLFRELVKVRYHQNFHLIENTIPLFRTTQWLWFGVAIFYTYGDFINDVCSSNRSLHYLTYYTKYVGMITFFLYSVTFIISITTLQKNHIRFQINQYCWSFFVLCLTVGQLKYVMHNIFNGIFWYVFPCCLVFTNDISAYVCGMMYGRKFIHRPFIVFSPNKTWEGFIGGWFCTMVVAWHLSRFLAGFSWMTCSINDFNLLPSVLECKNHPIFEPAVAVIPPQIFELPPVRVTKMLFPHIAEICRDATTNALTRCVSGEPAHSHDHFELSLYYFPIQLHAVWLALFASLVAPFGGFLASAIKRAYGIKDFDSIIPGHGGVMDRMDCQFLMALCTWVHYNSFVKFSAVSVAKLTYMYNLLSAEEKAAFLKGIKGVAKG